MKILFNRIVLSVVVLGLISLAVLGYWQKEKIFPSPFKVPLFAGAVIPELTGVLEKTGLAVSGQPVILGDSVIASISGIRVMFGTDKDFSTQVRALQLILGRLTIDKLPKEIDLRFSKAVLKY